MSSLSREIEEFFGKGLSEVEASMREAGEVAVDFNVKNGNYNNITFRLRRSNYFSIEKDGNVPTALVVGNSAPYASNVEARGRMVVSGGALHAESLLNKE